MKKLERDVKLNKKKIYGQSIVNYIYSRNIAAEPAMVNVVHLYIDKVAALAEPWTDVCKLSIDSGCFSRPTEKKMFAIYTWSNGYLLVHGQSCYISRTMDRCLQFLHGQSGCLLYMYKTAASAEPWTDVCIQYMNKCLLYMDKAATLAEPRADVCNLYMDKAAASAEPWAGVCNLYMVKMVTYCTWTKLLHQQNH